MKNLQVQKGVQQNIHSDDSVEKIFEILKWNQEELSRKELYYCLETTVSRKSTLTPLITNVDPKSTEDSSDTGEYRITNADGLTSGQLTTISKTPIPNLMIDEISNVSYYDCPDFGDTRDEQRGDRLNS